MEVYDRLAAREQLRYELEEDLELREWRRKLAVLITELRERFVLTKRAVRILEYAATGYTFNEIAQLEHLSPHYVPMVLGDICASIRDRVVGREEEAARKVRRARYWSVEKVRQLYPDPLTKEELELDIHCEIVHARVRAQMKAIMEKQRGREVPWSEVPSFVSHKSILEVAKGIK